MCKTVVVVAVREMQTEAVISLPEEPEVVPFDVCGTCDDSPQSFVRC
jgi:hypothetical protein